MAETPAPTLIGAKRVVVACEFSGDISESQRGSLCEQLVKKAQRYTSLPVGLAGPSDLALGPNIHAQADQLLLKIKGSVGNADGRKALALEVTPVRLATPMGTMTPLRSSASLVEINGALTLQGRIPPFEKLLGGGKPLIKPLTSDS